jgi:hypothetical protein
MGCSTTAHSCPVFPTYQKHDLAVLYTHALTSCRAPGM